MSFVDIKGQDRAISFLKSSLENKRIAHAYIFLGPAGVGKRLAALNFAKALNCVGESGERPCDDCVQCKKIDSFNHPDVFLVKPEKKVSIGIDQIRAVIKDISLKPYEGKSKIYIIDEAEALTSEASNALLKTLEEPPSDSVLILVVKDLNALFRTITSRSQVVRFFPLTTDTIEGILMGSHKMDKAKAHILSHISSGSLGGALRFKNEDFFNKRTVLIESLQRETFFDSDFDDLTKNELRLYLDMMLTWYRDILAKRIGAEDSALVNIDKKDAISGEAKRFDTDRLDGIIREIIMTNSYLDQNANPKLAMSVLGIKIQG